MVPLFKKSLLFLALTFTVTNGRMHESREEETNGMARNLRPAAPLKAIDLGSAEDFVILAKTGISTVPESDITGDIGVSPISATAMTGFALTKSSDGSYATSTQVSGKCYAADYSRSTPTILTSAVRDMETAYLAARRVPNADASRINLKGGNISGLTLTPGVYTFKTSIIITDDVFLDGRDSDVFVIQTTGVVFQADGVKVHLTGGVQPENVFWQVAGNVLVGTTAVMQGILLVKTDITMSTGSVLIGAAYSQTAVNLQMATVTSP